MINTNFSCVDLGCLMKETESGRWIVEHPLKGYFPTHSKMWDVLIEHPEKPHSKKAKFLGSFKRKKEAMLFVKQQLQGGISYFTAKSTSNKYYNSDYTKK